MPALAPSMADKDKKQKQKLILKLPRPSSALASSSSAAAAAAAAAASSRPAFPPFTTRPSPSSSPALAPTAAPGPGPGPGPGLGPPSHPLHAPHASGPLAAGPFPSRQARDAGATLRTSSKGYGAGSQGLLPGSGLATDVAPAATAGVTDGCAPARGGSARVAGFAGAGPCGRIASLVARDGTHHGSVPHSANPNAATPPKKRKFKTLAESTAKSASTAKFHVPEAQVQAQAGPVWNKPPPAEQLSLASSSSVSPPSPASLPPLAKKPALLIRRNEKSGEAVEIDPPSTGRQESDSLPPKQALEGVLDKLQKKDIYGVFAEPVDSRLVPDYYDVIKRPMDFGTIRKKLAKGVYSNLDQFEADIMLICSNAMRYNAPNTVYYKQAKAIQDLARKSLPALQQPGVDGELKLPAKLKSSAKKSGKKCPVGKSRFDPAGSDYTSGATLATDGDGGRGVGSERSGSVAGEDLEAPLGAWGGASQGGNLDTGWVQEEQAGNALKPMAVKDGRRPLSTEEYHRSSYKPRNLPAHGQGPVLAAVGGELQQLVFVGSQQDNGYARSLACFGGNLSTAAWKFVAKKIQKVLAPNVAFGPGWVGEPNTLVQTRKLQNGCGPGPALAKPGVAAEFPKPSAQPVLSENMLQSSPAVSSGLVTSAMNAPNVLPVSETDVGPRSAIYGHLKPASPAGKLLLESPGRPAPYHVPGHYGLSKPLGDGGSRGRDGKAFAQSQGFGSFPAGSQGVVSSRSALLPPVSAKQGTASPPLPDVQQATLSGDSAAEESKSGGLSFDFSLDGTEVPLKGLAPVFSKDGLIASTTTSAGPKPSDERNSRVVSKGSTQSRSSSSMDGQASASTLDGVVSCSDASVMQGGGDKGYKEDGQVRSAMQTSSKQSISQSSEETGGAAVTLLTTFPPEVGAGRGPGSWVQLQAGPCIQDQVSSRDRGGASIHAGVPGADSSFTPTAHVVPLSMLPTIMGVPGNAAAGVDEYTLKAWAQAQAQAHAMNLLQHADPKTRVAIQAQLAAGWQPLPVSPNFAPNLQAHYIQQQMNGGAPFAQPSRPLSSSPANAASCQVGHVRPSSKPSDSRDPNLGTSRQANAPQTGYAGNGRSSQQNASMMVLSSAPQQTGQMSSGRLPDLPRNAEGTAPFLGSRSVASQSQMQVGNPFPLPHPPARTFSSPQQQPPSQISGITNGTQSQHYAPAQNPGSISGTSRPMPPDLNICFQPPQSPTTSKTSPGPKILVDPQQPDLALQL